MEPLMTEYYNEIPSCFKTIEKLNEEFNELQKQNDKLKDKLEPYVSPTVFYSNLEEWKNAKENVQLLINTEINETIIENNGFIEIYDKYNIPSSINIAIEEGLQILTKNTHISWTYLTAYNIVNSIRAFLYSMSFYPCQVISNPDNLVNIICKHIEYIIETLTSNIPQFAN
jgi:hypothetical protein